MRVLRVAGLALGALAFWPCAGAHAAEPLESAAAPARQFDGPAPLEAFKALGPMPPDSEPSAQATWRIRRYDLEIEADRRLSEGYARNVARQRGLLARIGSDNPDDPRRRRILGDLDGYSTLQNLSELHAQAATAAKVAVGQFESVRLAVAAGIRPAADLVAARAKASQAERLAQAARQAQSDKSIAVLQTTSLTQGAENSATPWVVSQGAGLRLADVVAAQERARLEGIAYSEVREAVETGKRPPSDLEAARQSLKAAQVVVYDQLDIMTKANAALLAKLRADTAKHVADMAIKVSEQEKELPALGSAARAMAEERLRMSKELLEAFKANAAVSLRIAATPPRPALPILPPRP